MDDREKMLLAAKRNTFNTSLIILKLQGAVLVSLEQVTKEQFLQSASEIWDEMEAVHREEEQKYIDRLIQKASQPQPDRR